MWGFGNKREQPKSAIDEALEGDRLEREHQRSSSAESAEGRVATRKEVGPGTEEEPGAIERDAENLNAVGVQVLNFQQEVRNLVEEERDLLQDPEQNAERIDAIHKRYDQISNAANVIARGSGGTFEARKAAEKLAAFLKKDEVTKEAVEFFVNPLRDLDSAREEDNQ